MMSASDMEARERSEAAPAETDRTLTVERRFEAQLAPHASVSLSEGGHAFPGSNTLGAPASGVSGMKVPETAPGRMLSPPALHGEDGVEEPAARKERAHRQPRARVDSDIYSPAEGIGAAVRVVAGGEIRTRIR